MSTTLTLAQQRAAIARAEKSHDVDAAVVARRDYAAERLAEFVERTVASSPDLTPQQRDRIARLLIGGGSGVVPLMCMLRHQRRAFPEIPVRLLYSVRSPDDVFYRSELGEETTLTYTRRTSEGWTGATGRITAELDRAHADEQSIMRAATGQSAELAA